MPQQEVRPTQERVREALFSSLGERWEGLRVLDLFAGSGSLGLEAWSRGAEAVVFVEQHAAVWRNLQQTIESLKSDELGAVHCMKADVFRYLTRSGGSFELIFADPPYDLPEAFEQTLSGIIEHSVLTDDGVLVYELRSSDPFEIPGAWKLLRDKVYGDTRVLVLKLNPKEIL